MVNPLARASTKRGSHGIFKSSSMVENQTLTLRREEAMINSLARAVTEGEATYLYNL